MKQVAFLLWGLMWTGASHAQSFQWGVKAGVTRSHYAGDGTDTFEPLTGFHGGLVANLPVGRGGFWSLQPELLYAQKGAKVEENGTRFTSRLHYLDLPLLARLTVAGFRAEAGPQLGYLVSHDKRFTGPATAVEYQRLDVGYVAGIGYQLPNGLNVGGRYNGGVSELFGEVIGGTINPRNATFQFYVGYLVVKPGLR